MSLETNLFKDVDTTRVGEVVYVSDDIPVQTIVYCVEDVLGYEVYYSEEADRYIKNIRNSRITQKYVLNYLQKIPSILRDPSIVIIDVEDITESTLIYYKEVYIVEIQRQKLFALVVKMGELRVVYNLHPQESGKVKFRHEKPRVIYLKPGYKKSKYY